MRLHTKSFEGKIVTADLEIRINNMKTPDEVRMLDK